MIRLSVIIAARNEEQHIAQCLSSVLAGGLASQELEILVADGGSTDKTKEIVQAFCSTHSNIRLIDNPGKTAPAGFNIAIRASRGEAICILSAHSYVDETYFPRCLAKLESGEVDCVGGPMVTLPGSDNLESRMIMAITSSRFGVGSSFRTIRKEGPTDTVVFGVYRRDVFERIGLFDERLVRNQDNELNARLRAIGGKVWMVADAVSYYYNRVTFRRLFSQNFRNGLYGVLTWRINPASFSLRHAIPLLFVVFLLGGTAAAIFLPPLRYAFAAVLGLYGALAIGASLQQAKRFPHPLLLLMPLGFAALHIWYGVGTLLGLFRFGLGRLPGNVPDKLAPQT